MEPLALSGNFKLIAAIVLGLLVGALLVKSDFASRKKFLDGLRFQDGTMLSMFLFSVAVGSGMFFLAAKYGLVHMHVRPVYFWAALSGGIVAGLGAALCGSVPMTAVAEMATGKVTALWTVCGFLLAIPVVKIAAGMIDRLVSGWNRPMGGSAPFTASLFWTFMLCLAVALIIQFAVGGSDTKKN